MEKIERIPLLVKEWKRMQLCFAVKSPKSQLGLFF